MLKAFDAIKRREIQGQSWPTDLGAHIASYYSAEHIKRFQGRLWSHMKGWQTCRKIMSRPGTSQLERDLWRLSVFWWPEWHPLALKWWLEVHFARTDESEWNEKKGLFASRFRRLHRRCMAITLARFSETDRQKIFRNALDQDNRGVDVFANALSLSIDQRRKVDRTLLGQIHERDVWAPLTRWLEISRWHDDLPRLVASANAEHVRPRSMNWEEDDADDAQAYNEGCFSLGNLALVNKRANKKMLNAGFTDKMPVLAEEAEKFWTLRSVVEDMDGKPRTEWRNDAILVRAEALHQVSDATST